MQEGRREKRVDAFLRVSANYYYLVLYAKARRPNYTGEGNCYGVGGTGGKSRVARHVRAAPPVYLSFFWGGFFPPYLIVCFI
jgi:hypothetical protein